MKPVTTDDLRLVMYFHRDKGHLDSFTEWPSVRARIKEQHPLLWVAWADRQQAALKLANRDLTFLSRLQELIDKLDPD